MPVQTIQKGAIKFIMDGSIGGQNVSVWAGKHKGKFGHIVKATPKKVRIRFNTGEESGLVSELESIWGVG
jgi:hypothetical protein